LSHSGALAYLVHRYDLKATVYCTFPVYKLTKMAICDNYLNQKISRDFQAFTIDEIETALQNFCQLKYSQRITKEIGDTELNLTPYAAGHTLGGAIWKIAYRKQDILYIADFYHARVNHLEGLDLESVQNSAIMILDGFMINREKLDRSSEKKLHRNLMSTLCQQHGDVLIPADSCGTVLEILINLEEMWKRDENLQRVPVLFLQNVSSSTIEYVKSQIEWMATTISSHFNDKRTNPFEFNVVEVVDKLETIEEYPSPKVIVTSSAGMTCGLSKKLFIKMAKVPENKIIIVDNSYQNYLSSILLRDRPESLSLTDYERYAIIKPEMVTARAEREADEVLVEEDAPTVQQMATDINPEESDSESEDDDRFVSKQKRVYFRSGSFPMVAFNESRGKYDEYGETIPHDRTEAEETESQGLMTEMDTVKNFESTDRGGNADDANKIGDEIIQFGYEMQTHQVAIKAKVKYINFELRSDCNSIKVILTKLKPETVLLINTTPNKATTAFKQFIGDSVTPRIFSTELRNTLNVPVVIQKSAMLNISEQVFKSLDFREIGKNMRIASIKGSLRKMEENLAGLHQYQDKVIPQMGPLALSNKKEHEDVVMEGTENNSTTVKVENQESANESIRDDSVIFLGRLNLGYFQEVLQHNGFPSHFNQDGSLVVKNVAKISLNDDHQITFEGIYSPEFYKLRELLYSIQNALGVIPSNTHFV